MHFEPVFSQISFQREFPFDEIVQQADFGFARSTSTGTLTILNNGATVPEEARELFVLQKVNEQGKIARYMFNRMSPQQQIGA